METAANEGLPVRLVSRLTSELALMNLRESLRLIPGRLETSVVAQALLRGGLPHLVADGALVLPDTRPLVGSVSALARSFERSPETVRRHVHVLARQGVFTVQPDGVRLEPKPPVGERILFFLRSMHDGLLWLVEELHGWGLVRVPPRRSARPVPVGAILRTALDLRLAGFETFRGPIGGWTSMSLWNVLSTLSVRHVTTDRALSRQFTSRSTPDALRRPTTLRALSVASGLPYATVWRHMAALEKAGRVGRTGEGYIMRTGQLLSDEIEGRVASYVQDALHRVERLSAEGLDPEAIPSLFLGRRPGLVPAR